MRSRSSWTRRQVMQAAMSLTGLALTGPLRAMQMTLRSRYAYVGSAEGPGGIHVFACASAGDTPHWTPIQQLPCLQPGSLVLHPRGHMLYAANEIKEDEGLPRGSVEAFAVNLRTGMLTKLNRQPLSLSGTLPRHLAVSPCGSYLVAAVYGGGACNVLPISRDGSLGRVSGVYKQTGAGPHPEHQRSAHPHTVLFDLRGRYLLASDLGADRVSLFSRAEGRLELISRATLPPGSGPGQMELDSSGQVLVVANQLQNSVSTFKYDPHASHVLTPLHTTRLGKKGHSCSMLLHRPCKHLYTAVVDPSDASTTVASWSINAHTGTLSQLDAVVLPQSSLEFADAQTGSTATDGIYLLDQTRGAIVHLVIAPSTGLLGASQSIATVPHPRSLTLL